MGKRDYRAQIACFYRRASGFDLAVCAYCGYPRQALDHVPPLRLACDLDLEAFRKAGGQLLLYPSCHDCNAFLGKKPLATFEERLGHLWFRYGEKIRDRTWTDGELAELGPGLRAYIAGSAARNAEFIAKLRGVEQTIFALRSGRLSVAA